MVTKPNQNLAAWNIFQGNMRILKKKQKQILKDFRDRLTAQQVEQLKGKLS
jgi:hypothetical protein